MVQVKAHKRKGRYVKAHKRFKNKVHKVMHEFKYGRLHSGSKKGPIVTDRKQAIAIALSEQERENIKNKKI
jgi:hypothetical protein